MVYDIALFQVYLKHQLHQLNAILYQIHISFP